MSRRRLVSTRRHLRLWKQCLTQAVRRDLQFRTQAFTTAVTAVVDLALALVPVLILTNATAGRGGWSGPLSIAVVGAYGLGSSLIDCFVAPNLRRMDSYVRRGDLDLVLIRPVCAPLYTALGWIQPSEHPRRSRSRIWSRPIPPPDMTTARKLGLRAVDLWLYR